MEFSEQARLVEEEEGCQPVSPTAEYFNSSALSISILAILEFEIPLQYTDSLTKSLVTNVFLPISPRFSSIMVTDDHGVKQWKKVDVKLENHVYIPIFPEGSSPEYNDIYLQEYLSKLAMDQLPQSQPLWEIHIIKYPTSNAAGSIIFKLHHALGDGFSIMGALLSCLQRADDPSLPVTFPSIRSKIRSSHSERNIYKTVPRFLSMFLNSTLDFITGLLKSSVMVDDRTPIRSGTEGVEFLPLTISSTAFSLDHIKQIKAKIGGTVNDIIVGAIFYGSRLYMQTQSKGSSDSCSTALVLLNTRLLINTYLTIQEMAKGDVKSPWGNHFTFLHIPIPKSGDPETMDPLTFVSKAKQTIKRKKNSLGVHLTARFLEIVRKFGGPEATARCIYNTLKNSSMAITNVIGPIEKIALADHPCKGIYYMVVNNPQSLTITIVSYMGELRVSVGSEKGFIDHQLFTSCLERAFERIFKAAVN